MMIPVMLINEGFKITERLEKSKLTSVRNGKIWGKLDEESVSIDPYEILYIESVDDKVFAYTPDKVIKLDGTLSSFVNDIADESFFRCSKAMIINVNKEDLKIFQTEHKKSES